MDKFEVLKKYKELLDNGIITQEEFENKKKEILEAPEGSSKLDSIMKSAKAKTGDIKDKTSKKLEELKTKQAEEAEKRKIEAEPIKQKFSQIINNSVTEDEIPIEITTESEIPVDVITTQSSKSKPPKKKFYKQKWFWIVIAVLLIFSLFGGNGNDDKKATDESVDVVEEQTQDQEEPTSKPTSESTSESKSDSSSSDVTDDVFLSTLNASYEGQGTWKIAGDRHFAFYPEGDLADAFIVTGTYYAQYGEIPAELEENFNYMCNSLKELSKTMSDTAGEACALSVVNPSNTDNVLITYMNGETLYNAFEE